MYVTYSSQLGTADFLITLVEYTEQIISNFASISRMMQANYYYQSNKTPKISILYADKSCHISNLI